MAVIGRSFDELNPKIKEMNENLKQSDAQLKKVNQSIKLDSGNVEAVRQKFANLSTQLTQNVSKLDLLKQKQAALNADLASGALSQANYNKQLATTEKQVRATELSITNLTAQLRLQNTEVRNAKFDNFTAGMGKAQAASQKFANIVMIGVGALVAFVVASAKVADELDDVSKKYQTTAEELQIQRNLYAKLTTDSGGYEANLTKIGKIMTALTKGSGQAYINLLSQIGVTQADLTGKTNAEVYQIIANGLSTVANSAEQAALAQALLGDSGLDLATILQTQQSTIDGLNEELIKNGLITNEQAEIAGKWADKISDVKNSLMAFGLKILEWWDSIGPIGQGVLVFLVSAAVLLPKIIGFISGFAVVIKILGAAAGAATPGIAGLSLASSKFLIIIGLVSAAIIGLVILFAILTGKSKEASESIAQAMGSLDNYGAKLEDMNADLGFSTETTYASSTHRTTDINVNIDAQGETPIADANAVSIAEKLYSQFEIDQINQGLGGVIK